VRWVIALAAAAAIGYLAYRYWESTDPGDPNVKNSAALSAYIAEWSTAYQVDPLAVNAIIRTPNTGEWDGSFDANGDYPVGDGGTSFGPMQVHTDPAGGGAIEQFEQDHSVTVDTSILSDPTGSGASLAVQIGTYYLSLCIKNANGINPTSFSNYNAGVGHYSFPDASDYGNNAYAYYQQIGGKA
jgi:hypothetical protein